MTSSSPENSDVRENETKTPGNIFRDTALRYIGYMGHLGWICRQFIPYHLTSMATVTYVCADAFVKASKAASSGESDQKVISSAGDVFLWHFLATFALPGIFLHGVNSVTCQMQSFRSKCRPRSTFYLLPCFLSTLTIPFIVKPIDRTVDEFMNKYIRKSVVKESIMEISDNMCDEENVHDHNLKFKWFYDQSRDLHALELERYHRKLEAERERERQRAQLLSGNLQRFSKDNKESASSVSVESVDGLKNKAVQVDRTSRPPKPGKQQKTAE